MKKTSNHTARATGRFITPRRRAAATPPLQFLRGAAGRIRIDARHRLVYEVETAAGPHAASQTRRVAVDGVWSLGRDERVTFTARERAAAGRRVVTIRGTVVRADAHRLVVALRRGQGTASRTETVTLEGRWQADAHNRLTFRVARGRGREDQLTLQGVWEVGRSHQVQYRFRRRATGSGDARAHTLMLDGAWDIRRAGWLTYRVLAQPGRPVEFRAGLRRGTLAARDGRLTYDVAIGVGRSRRARRVTLAGRWALHRDLSVSFEVPYTRGRVTGIRLEGRLASRRGGRLAVALRTRRGDPLGATVTFTRQTAPDLEWFLELRRGREERALFGGLRRRF